MRVFVGGGGVRARTGTGTRLSLCAEGEKKEVCSSGRDVDWDQAK